MCVCVENAIELSKRQIIFGYNYYFFFTTKRSIELIERSFVVITILIFQALVALPHIVQMDLMISRRRFFKEVF
jgi:hypothetical protein